MNNKEALDDYFEVFKLRGNSDLTAQNYRYTYKDFFGFCNKNYADVNTKDIRKYLIEKKKSVKSRTIINYINTLSSFFSYMKEEGHIEENPLKRIRKPNVNDNERRYLKLEEIELIRLDIDNLFDLALFEVLYSSGLRVSEAVDLNWSDINLNSYEIRVRQGKGDKARDTKLSIKAGILLKRYRKSRNDDNVWVFQSQYRRRMSKESIERHIRDIGLNVGLEIPLTPHKLRHSFATTLSRKGTPIEVIQELMGHEDINTTKRYIEVSKDNINYHFNQAFA